MLMRYNVFQERVRRMDDYDEEKRVCRTPERRMIMDPYTELGVNPDASEEEIKSAYRTLAKKYHPDANPLEENAAEKMNRINAAYAMLRGGSADLFPDEDWFQEQAENISRRSLLYHPTFRRVVVLLIAASMAVVGIVSAFFSGLWPY